MDNNTKSGILIFSGYNLRGIIAFCRFCKKSNILFSIVASDDKDAVFKTCYKDNIIAIRKTKNLVIEDVLKYGSEMMLHHSLASIFLLPSSEYLNRFYLCNETLLRDNNLFVPLCNKELYELVSDKYSFGKLCAEHLICVPEEYTDINKMKMPFVAKPRQYFTDDNYILGKPQIINNAEELLKLKRSRFFSSYYFQKFIGGKSIYLLYYFSKSGKYCMYAQENLIQQSNGRSIIAAKAVDPREHAIIFSMAELFNSRRFTGLVMVEVKLFEGKYFVIEANPRIWGPSQLILDAGMNLFYMFAIDMGLIAQLPELNYKINTKYFWSGGMQEDYKNKNYPAYHDYNEQDFFNERQEWIEADVYNCNDTKALYKAEII